MSGSNKRKARILDSARAMFDAPVLRLEAPGGEGRSSYRLVFEDRTVIATLRPNFRRTHVEAFTLMRLRPFCTDLPECLGVDGEILFQSDVGGTRLGVEMVKGGRARKLDLAHQAVESIFRIQAAGRRAGLHDALPHLGQNRDWLRGFVDGVDALRPFCDHRSATLDRAALCAALDRPGLQFVKWDCRSGNAAVGDDGAVRWFDCEYSGVRHGCEDLAWLIGDEAWPLRPDAMEAVVADGFDPACGHGWDDYLDYLSLYTTFHAAQRFQLIVREVRKRDWMSKSRVRKCDDVGAHPEFAARICRVGAHFAARHPATRPVALDFEQAERHFLTILKDSLPLETA